MHIFCVYAAFWCKRGFRMQLYLTPVCCAAQQRRARGSGRMASMNLDDALAGAEMAQQYPVGPSMPIQAPSDSQQPSSPSSGSGSRPRTTSGSQNRSSNQVTGA